MPFCSKCGRQVEENASFCQNCGAALTQQPQPTQYSQPTVPTHVLPRPVMSTKNEGLAAVLSFLFSGLGQIYVGRIGRGLGILLGGIVIALIGWILLWIPLLVYWVWNIYDAYNLAKEYNQELMRTGNPPW